MAEYDPFFVRKIEYSRSRTCGHLFKGMRDQTRTVSFHPTGDCTICYDGSGLRMTCGHYICPDDILDWAWQQISNMKYEINCTLCKETISQDDIIRFGLPTLEEKQFLLTAISTNLCESQDIQECPQCRTLCQRTKTDNPQVHCNFCPEKRGKSFMFCWYCMREWMNASNIQVCGNEDCKGGIIEKLIHSHFKEIADRSGKRVSIPSIRACPNCHTLLEHKDGCNQFTCSSNNCGLNFCFICLTCASGGSLICKSSSLGFAGILCTPAPIQTKLR